MTQYLLALYRDYAVSLPPEQTRQVWADVNALGDRLTDAGAFVFQGGIDGGAESATVVRQSGGDFQVTGGGLRRRPRAHRQPGRASFPRRATDCGRRAAC